MALFRFMWLRRLIRRHTTPIPYRKANRYRNFLSVAYAICAWNLLGYLLWEYTQGRGTKEAYGLANSEIDMLSPAQQFALQSGIEKAKIIRSSNITETVDFRLEDFAHLKPTPDEDANDDDDEDNVA